MHLSPSSPRIFRSGVGLLCIVALALGACGTTHPGGTDADQAQQVDNGDPLEGFNRAVYGFNEAADRYVLKPVATGYQTVVPSPVRRGVSNFFGNLHDPVIMLNSLLQGKPGNAVEGLGRFLMNSTIGLFGLIDVASEAGLPKRDEDFGQTLAVWGLEDGPYLVFPILGPSNLRDGVGLVPDWYLYPPNRLENEGVRNSLLATEVVNRRSQLLEASDILEQAGGHDPYVFLREAYRQRRLYDIHDGNPPQAPPDPSLFEDDPPPAESGAAQP